MMDIEKLATAAVIESISSTENLSAFINNGDKEPTWDGNIYIYANKHNTKKGIKKVPVQGKGKLPKIFPPQKPPKFSVSIVDLDNWLNDGGVILFVVMIDETGHEKAIFYNNLLPIKIHDLKKKSQGKKKISIPLTRFPEDRDGKVSVLLNFYINMQKQTSFANAQLYSINELRQKGVLEDVIVEVPIYCKQKSAYDMESLFFQNDLYMYANIKGSSIPQPLPDILMDPHITKVFQGNIEVMGRVYYHNYRTVRYAGGSDILFGKSIVFKLSPDMKRINIDFKLKGTLTDYIQDTECIIAILENREFSFNGVKIPFDYTKNIDIEQFRKMLFYFKDVKKMLDILGVRKELDCDNLSEQDKNNLRNFTNAVVYGRSIGFPNSEGDVIYGRYKISNLVLLLWGTRDSDKGYKLKSFFSDCSITLFNADDKNKERPYHITHYVLLKKNDILEAANVDYKKILEGLDHSDTSPVVTERINSFMLEMLKAYDEQKEKDEELLSTAEKYSDWLIKNSNTSNDMLVLNRLQIVKRKREFSVDELTSLQDLRKSDRSLPVRCAANLLLGKNASAQDCFDEMDNQVKDRFIELPICNFGKLTYEKAEERRNG